MEKFIFRDAEIDFKSLSGTVLDSAKMSETHISSSGGGGYIGPNGGLVAPSEISSRVVTNHEFWLEKEDGTELSVKLRGVDIPLRSGQKVTLTSCKKRSKKPEGEWHYASIVNHNARSYWVINDGRELNEVMKAEPLNFWVVLLCFVMSCVAFIIASSVIQFLGVPMKIVGPWILTAGAILFSYLLIKRARRTSGFENKLSAHIKKISQELL